MGAKYQPSKRDLKANRSFQKKQPAQSKFIRPSGTAAQRTPVEPVRPADPERRA